MAFDRTDQAQLNALKTEVETDPAGLGYNPGSTGQVLNLLNDPASNPGGETVGARLTSQLLFDAVLTAPDDLNAQGQFSEGDQIVIRSFLAQPLEADLEVYRSRIQAILPNGGARNALLAQTRPLSRAEVLFGSDTVIDRDDWFAARDNGVII